MCHRKLADTRYEKTILRLSSRPRGSSPGFIKCERGAFAGVGRRGSWPHKRPTCCVVERSTRYNAARQKEFNTKNTDTKRKPNKNKPKDEVPRAQRKQKTKTPGETQTE